LTFMVTLMEHSTRAWNWMWISQLLCWAAVLKDMWSACVVDGKVQAFNVEKKPSDFQVSELMNEASNKESDVISGDRWNGLELMLKAVGDDVQKWSFVGEKLWGD
ncbi:hypothetical protein HPP92_027827, partial [Vanilla planifolia]